MTSPEHRYKLRRVFTVGHGLYMDAHVNPAESSWYIDRSGSTSAKRLQANAAAAFAAPDGYLWIYGERARWWPGGSNSRPSWEEKLPGATQALRIAADRLGTARQQLKSVDRSKNLLSSGKMEKATAKGWPADWSPWQDERSNGTFTHQPSLAIATGVTGGFMSQSVAVEPGETYLASTQIRKTGRGFVSLTIGWKSAEGDWFAYSSQFAVARSLVACVQDRLSNRQDAKTRHCAESPRGHLAR